MATKKKTVSPRLGKQALAYVESYFSNRNAGAQVVLDGFPNLFARSMDSLRGQLERGELMLLIDVHNGYAITPSMLGAGVAHQVADAISLDGAAEKHGINGQVLLDKLQGMHHFDLAALEIWANAFWYGRWEGCDDLSGDKLERWISRLLPAETGEVTNG